MEKPNLRPKKQRKLPGSFKKDTFVVREDLGDNETPREDIIYGIKASPCTNSMNKKGRWKLLESMKYDIQDWQGVDMRRTAVEGVYKPFYFAGDYLPGEKTRMVTGYHTVAEGEEVHRKPRKSFSSQRTLTEKPKPPKKKRNRNRRESEENEEPQVPVAADNESRFVFFRPLTHGKVGQFSFTLYLR